MPIVGPIDYKQSIWTKFGYMTSSQAVREDFNRLMMDDQITRIVFDIDSPGGLYSGLPELARDVFNSRGKKQTVSVANPLAASGALWLGASAEKFYCLGSGQAGSLGSLMMHADYSRAFDSMGITHTILRDPTGKADFNPYEPLSDDSREHHQQVISAITDEFTAAIAKFRGVSKSVAASSFGQGRVLNARDAVSAGLVDGVVDSLQSVLGPRIKAGKRVRLHPRLALARVQAAKKAAEAN